MLYSTFCQVRLKSSFPYKPTVTAQITPNLLGSLVNDNAVPSDSTPTGFGPGLSVAATVNIGGIGVSAQVVTYGVGTGIEPCDGVASGRNLRDNYKCKHDLLKDYLKPLTLLGVYEPVTTPALNDNSGTQQEVAQLPADNVSGRPFGLSSVSSGKNGQNGVQTH
ncbi:unnamed protein product [Peronospora belbahrii]|uniref:Uncharacterized protein n=1 Tax=Peronospora belbahrii TaxID=622444 RepID=A0AAU9L3Q3_9STRA|nr:unnamed protein product [Peronospora belbahrii]CAH0519452.1 unnamed protein product [Peronospora belbahrii]